MECDWLWFRQQTKLSKLGLVPENTYICIFRHQPKFWKFSLCRHVTILANERIALGVSYWFVECLFSFQIFEMDVTNEVMRLSEDDICCQLKRICRIADQHSDTADEAVGILTTQSRDEWARCRERLLEGNMVTAT